REAKAEKRMYFHRHVPGANPSTSILNSLGPFIAPISYGSMRFVARVVLWAEGNKALCNRCVFLFSARLRLADSLTRARILLADDHRSFPEMEERLLEPEFEVVGKVVDGQALFEKAMRLRPDVIVTDISMPLLNGIEAVDKLHESGCNSKIVFLT